MLGQVEIPVKACTGASTSSISADTVDVAVGPLHCSGCRVDGCSSKVLGSFYTHNVSNPLF